MPDTRVIVVPVKGQSADHEAFRLACRLAKEDRAKIYALYVIEVARELPEDAEISEETARAEEVLSRIESLAKQERYPVVAEVVQARQAGAAIVQEAAERGAKLVVLGEPYKRQLGSFNLGDNVMYILKHAICPVLLWREPIPIIAVPGGATDARAFDG